MFRADTVCILYEDDLLPEELLRLQRMIIPKTDLPKGSEILKLKMFVEFVEKRD